MAIEIPLTRGKVALIDEADHGLASQWKWFAHKRRDHFYAATNLPAEGGQRGGTLSLHVLLLGPRPGPGYVADHINRDTLDNRRVNLRWVTRAQNKANAKRHRNAGSRFKGVHRLRSGAWMARITVAGRRRWLGSYRSEEAAAAAYDAAALEHFGEHAFINGVASGAR